VPRFMLAIFGDDAAYQALDEEQSRNLYAGHEAFVTALADAGVPLEAAAELAPANTARTLRPDGTVLDGPLHGSQEHLGGFYVIDVAGIEDAVEWARRIPLLHTDRIEVRKTTDAD
jgi:hypothetical protein